MNLVKNLCDLLREDIAVPVFEHTLPDGYAKRCIVVREELHDYLAGETECHINIYTPNITRTVDGQDDNSCPDTEALDDLNQQVRHVLQGFWNSLYDLNLVTSQLVREGAMHHLNICLTIQFN